MHPLFMGWQDKPENVSFLTDFFQQMDSPDVLLIGFNAAFDIHKLYGVRKKLNKDWIQPLKCKVLDLQIPAMLHSPLAPFAFKRGKGSKSVAAVRRIPRAAKVQVIEAVTKVIGEQLPPVIGLSVSEHEVKGKPELVSLSWHIDGRLSLKGLMKTYGLPTLDLKELWPLPDAGEEEPWNPNPQECHERLEPLCDAILNEPEHSFWKYAELDIWFLKVLEEKLGFPEPDHHSACVHAVAYTRFYGLDVDLDRLKETERKYAKELEDTELALVNINPRSSKSRLMALQAVDPLVQNSSKATLLVAVQTGRPSAALAGRILGYGPAKQRLDQVRKVLRLGRAHPDFRVMGTGTARMGGTSGFNWQGVGASGKDKLDLRSCILTPMVGDFSAFEVTIAAAAYQDSQLQEDLDKGIDLHCMAVAVAHPEALKRGVTYEQVYKGYKTGDATMTKWRKSMKSIVFGIFYGAQKTKVAETLGVTEAEGQRVLDLFLERYQGIGRFRSQIEKAFCTADTERWNPQSVSYMDDSITDMTGFTRSWAFEKRVAVALWNLGNKGIKTGLLGSVTRNQEKGPQPIDQAIRSACLGSAIAIQAAVARQAGNMPIQATGANLCKMLMAELWEALRCPMVNVHDELFFGHHRNFNKETVVRVIQDFETRWRVKVPSIKFDYKTTERWSDK